MVNLITSDFYGILKPLTVPGEVLICTEPDKTSDITGCEPMLSKCTKYSKYFIQIFKKYSGEKDSLKLYLFEWNCLVSQTKLLLATSTFSWQWAESLFVLAVIKYAILKRWSTLQTNLVSLLVEFFSFFPAACNGSRCCVAPVWILCLSFGWATVYRENQISPKGCSGIWSCLCEI